MVKPFQRCTVTYLIINMEDQRSSASFPEMSLAFSMMRTLYAYRSSRFTGYDSTRNSTFTPLNLILRYTKPDESTTAPPIRKKAMRYSFLRSYVPLPCRLQKLSTILRFSPSTYLPNVFDLRAALLPSSFFLLSSYSVDGKRKRDSTDSPTLFIPPTSFIIQLLTFLYLFYSLYSFHSFTLRRFFPIESSFLLSYVTFYILTSASRPIHPSDFEPDRKPFTI